MTSNTSYLYHRVTRFTPSTQHPILVDRTWIADLCLMPRLVPNCRAADPGLKKACCNDRNIRNIKIGSGPLAADMCGVTAVLIAIGKHDATLVHARPRQSHRAFLKC